MTRHAHDKKPRYAGKFEMYVAKDIYFLMTCYVFRDGLLVIACSECASVTCQNVVPKRGSLSAPCCMYGACMYTPDSIHTRYKDIPLHKLSWGDTRYVTAPPTATACRSCQPKSKLGKLEVLPQTTPRTFKKRGCASLGRTHTVKQNEWRLEYE